LPESFNEFTGALPQIKPVGKEIRRTEPDTQPLGDAWSLRLAPQLEERVVEVLQKAAA